MLRRLFNRLFPIGPAVRPQLVPQPDLLIFLHIAKTAGTSIGAALNRNFTFEECATGFSRSSITALGMTELDTMTAELATMIGDRGHIRFVGGHIGYGAHRSLPERQPLYVTVVREPVERALSNFSYVARQGIVPGIPPDMTVEEYIGRDSLNLWFSNAQVRALSENPEINGSGLPTTANITMCRPIKGNDYKDVLQRALSPNVLVTPLDRLDQMMVLIAGLFDFPLNSLVFGRENVNDRRPRLGTLKPKILRAIRRANAYDCKLYKVACRRMEDICAPLGAPFAEDVAAFRGLQEQLALGVALEDLPVIPPTWALSWPARCPPPASVNADDRGE